MDNIFQVGDTVSLADNATYFTGQPIAPWVKELLWKVKSISGNRIVLGDSADGHYTLNAPVDAKYLKLSNP